MSNQQIFPNSVYPGAGDILTNPGSPLTTVVGIQTIPFSPAPPTDGQVPVFVSALNEWLPSSISNTQANRSIQVNGVVMSDDYEASVNDVLGISNSGMFVNGA